MNDAFWIQLGSTLALIATGFLTIWSQQRKNNQVIKAQVETRIEQPAKDIGSAVVSLQSMANTNKLLVEVMNDLRTAQAAMLIDKDKFIEKQSIELDALTAERIDDKKRLNTYIEMTEQLSKDLEVITKDRSERGEMIRQLTGKVAAMEAALQGTQAELDRTRNELAETKRALAVAERRINELENQRDAERTAAKQEKEVLEQQLSEERQKVTALQDKVTHLEQEVERLTNELNAAKSQPVPTVVPVVVPDAPGVAVNTSGEPTVEVKPA